MTSIPGFLSDGGAMGARLRELERRDTPLGRPTTWPPELRTLVSVMLASNQPMFICWGPEQTLLYNDGYAPILGNKHPDALGRGFLEVWDEIRADLEPIVQSAYAGTPVQMADIPLVMNRHGYPEETHFSFFYSPVRGAGGGVAGFFCACNEITMQVQAERQLAAREARYRSVLGNMHEGFVLMDDGFRLVELNFAAIDMIEIEASQLLGRIHWDAFPGSYDSDQGRMYREVRESGTPRTLEQEFAFPDGSMRRCEVRAFPVDDGVAVFFRDTTHAWQAQQQAETAAERMQLALEAGAIIGTWVWNVPENIVTADERFAASFGLDPAQCREGLPLDVPLQSIHPEDAPRVAAAVNDALRDGGQYRCEYRVRRQSGDWYWVEANGRVEMDAAGTPLRFPGVLLEVEDRRRTLEERDRATQLLEAFAEAVPGVVYAKDREGRFLVVNRGAAELLGRPAEACLGLTDRDLIADAAQADALMATDRRVMEQGNALQIEETVHLPSGEPATWLSTKAPFRDADGQVIGLIGSSLDITERKRIEEALRLSEQRSAVALEIAQLGTWTWDPQQERFDADARCRQLCGLPEGPVQLTYAQVRECVHPDDRERVDSAFAGALDPAGGGVYTQEFRWVMGDGSVVWTFSRGRTAFDDSGATRRPALLVGSVIDVTERRRMIDTLHEADRRKDEFLAMLAHELRNPLAPIGTAAQLLALAPDDPVRVRHASGVIARQVGHMTDLVDDLLDVSRVTRGLVELERAPVDLQRVVAAAVEQAEPLIRARGHALAVHADAGALWVDGDRNRLVQVVANLLNNAAKYTPPNGHVTLTLGNDGTLATIRVTDSGIGIDAALMPHVFDLFTQAARTPDRSQGGLGIGLGLVRSLVHLHGGSVQAASVGTGHGSTFTVTLPQIDARITATPASDAGPQPAARCRLLVVDDNVDAAMTLADALSLWGHEVEVAHDGRAALELAARDTFDACVLDVGLPDMTGFDLARTLRAQTTGTSLLLVALTGYGQSHDRAMSREAGFDHHLVKPADLDVLERLLATHCAARTSPGADS